MYKAIFVVLLSSAGLASGAQEGFGDYGGSGVWGSYGRYWQGGGGAPYYRSPETWTFVYPATAQPAEDTRFRDMEKRVSDLTSALTTLTNRGKELEIRLEQQTQLSDLQAKLLESNKAMQKELLDAIAKINTEAGDKKMNDLVDRKVNEIVIRIVPEIIEKRAEMSDKRAAEAEKRAELAEKRAAEIEKKALEFAETRATEIADKRAADLERRLADLKNDSKNASQAGAGRLEKLELSLSQQQSRFDQLSAEMKGNGDRRVSELEAKLSRVESDARASKQEASTIGDNLKLMVNLLEQLAKNTANVSHDDAGFKKTILDALGSFNQNNKPQAQVQETPIRSGYSLNRSLIIVELPADARLMVDNHASIPGTNMRTFISPELEAGKTYFYNLHVEVTRNNKIFVTDQKIHFQPGREYKVNFENLETTIANSMKLEKGK